MMPRLKRTRSEEPQEQVQRRTGARDQPLVPSSDDNIIVPEDDEDIPYTHANSRTTSPLSDLSSEDGIEIMSALTNTARTNTARTVKTSVPSSLSNNDSSAPQIEIVDVDDELKEYYVISEDEDDGKEESASQKTVKEQLEDTSRQSNSNLNNVHCAVCFESPESTYILPCGHVYCGDCVFKALSSTKQSNRSGGPCSLCRAHTPYRRVTVAILKKKRKVLI